VETQYNYQKAIGSNSVVIVYDAVQTSKGKLWIKAFRLTAEFMKQYEACGGNMTQETLKYSEVLEEVPIRIHNSGLINAFLFEQRQAENSTCDFDRLDLATNSFLEKNLEFLCEWVDDLSMEMSRFQNYERQSQRQKAEQQRWIQKRVRDDLICVLSSSKLITTPLSLAERREQASP
jgi:translation initiation factor 3 subunit H